MYPISSDAPDRPARQDNNISIAGIILVLIILLFGFEFLPAKLVQQIPELLFFRDREFEFGLEIEHAQKIGDPGLIIRGSQFFQDFLLEFLQYLKVCFRPGFGFFADALLLRWSGRGHSFSLTSILSFGRSLKLLAQTGQKPDLSLPEKRLI